MMLLASNYFIWLFYIIFIISIFKFEIKLEYITTEGIILSSRTHCTNFYYSKLKSSHFTDFFCFEREIYTNWYIYTIEIISNIQFFGIYI